MAIQIGYPGRSAADAIHRKFVRQLYFAVFIFTFGGLLAGWSFHGLLPLPPHNELIIALIIVFIGWIALKNIQEVDRTMEDYQRERENWRRGVDGELLIAEELRTALPDGFFIINDIIKRRGGNIDHIIVGPTGVFAINAKNWKGTVTPSADGELLINKRPTSHREVHRLAGTAKELKNAILSGVKVDLFVQPLLIFESTRVEVPSGKVGVVHCLWKEKAAEHIQNHRSSRPLTDEQVNLIRDFLSRMAAMVPVEAQRD